MGSLGKNILVLIIDEECEGIVKCAYSNVIRGSSEDERWYAYASKVRMRVSNPKMEMREAVHRLEKNGCLPRSNQSLPPYEQLKRT